MTAQALNNLIGGVKADKVLGYIVAWDLREIKIDGGQLCQMFDNVGLDSKKYVRKIISRNVFLRALKELETDRIIRRVSEDKSEMQYQFTHEFLNSQKDILEYQYEHKVRYNKDSRTIMCDDAKLGTIVQNLVTKYDNTYKTSDITRFVQQIFNNEGDILSLRDNGSLYFVPVQYGDLIVKVKQLLSALSGPRSFKSYPILKVDDSIEDVKKAFTDEGKDLLDKINSAMGDIAGEKDSKLRKRLVQNRLDKLVELKNRATLYNKLLEFQFKDVEEAITKTNKALAEALAV
jgi:hypothetical protein